MKAIVALGNTGNKYKKTRHNAGFMVIDHLAKEQRIPLKTEKHNALFGKGIIRDVEVIIAKPTTFMNLSGNAVKKILYKFSVDIDDLLVVHDDIDLLPGKVKKKKGGGDAGHRGIRSIIQMLGTRDFSRVRIGIGRPEDDTDISDWVLHSFSKEEKDSFNQSLDLAIEKIYEFLK